jgi:hypothetical protein
MSDAKGGVPIEQFIQALTTQLDRAQNAMALKAENLDLPLTFAVKDLSLDLRTHVEVVKSVVRIRPAAPGDVDASTLHLSLTTITKPMIRENAKAMKFDPQEQTLKDADLTEEEQNRLEWAGIHTVDQLRRSTESGGGGDVERVASLPVDRLRQALSRASNPQVERIEPYGHSEGLGNGSTPLLRIQGRNLIRNGAPRVSIAGQPVSILKATNQEVVIAPLEHQFGGMLSIETAAGSIAEAMFDLTPHMAPPAKEAKVAKEAIAEGAE